mgnify:CR=1 FL=1
MLMADQELRPFAGVLRDRWNLRWPKDVYHAAGYERICKGFKLRILGFEVPEKKKEAPLDDEIFRLHPCVCLFLSPCSRSLVFS